MSGEAEVIPGKGRGTRIGFPTLNFKIPENFPWKQGIYAGFVIGGGERYRAVFHYGPIPTFNEAEPSLEAFLLDGAKLKNVSRLSFEFMKYLREIRTFESIDALAEQIRKDVQDASRVLGT